ncbi:MAG: hypothetical protein IT431_07920 [Phycisphaerales bacterium]|nr:hypothetical protein [Phycisphaerales bacterium]
MNLSPSAGRRGTGRALAGASGSVGGWAVGAGDGSEDVGGGSAAFDGALGGLAEFAEGVEGFLGDLVVVALALEGAELFEGFVGVLDVGLGEPGRELEGGEGGVGEGEEAAFVVGGEGGRDGETKRRRDGVGGRGEWRG